MPQSWFDPLTLLAPAADPLQRPRRADRSLSTSPLVNMVSGRQAQLPPAVPPFMQSVPTVAQAMSVPHGGPSQLPAVPRGSMSAPGSPFPQGNRVQIGTAVQDANPGTFQIGSAVQDVNPDFAGGRPFANGQQMQTAGEVAMNPLQSAGQSPNSWMNIPDRTPEQLLMGAATNFTNDYAALPGGRIVPTRNAERRLAALGEIGQQQQRIAGDQRFAQQLAQQREQFGQEQAGLNQRAQAERDVQNNQTVATMARTLLESGQVTDPDEAMNMARRIVGTQGAAGGTGGAGGPVPNPNSPTSWQQPNVRRILDEVAGVTRQGPFASAPTMTDIAQFQRTLAQRYPSVNFGNVIEDYIRAVFPPTTVSQWTDQARREQARYPDVPLSPIGTYLEGRGERLPSRSALGLPPIRPHLIQGLNPGGAFRP